MKMKRSHGMAREGSPEYFEKYKLENPHLLPSFLFITQGYNFRNHELPAV
jgi:CDP-6-deoxy-D-xylo-4-hexulose-3-dehydrase